MYSHPRFAQTAEEAQSLRQQAGRWLKSLREEKGMSQRDLAKEVGLEYYTFVSQLEAGRGRVPPGQYEAFARALNVPLREFVKTLMRFYDPLTYYALFESEDVAAGNDNAPHAANAAHEPVEQPEMAELAARLARLEDLLAKKSPK